MAILEPRRRLADDCHLGRGIAPETLVNVWLVERLQQATG